MRLHGSAGEAQESARVADKVHWMASAGEGVVARSRSAMPPKDPSVICSIFHTHNLQRVTHENVREYTHTDRHTHTRVHVNHTFDMMFHNGKHFQISEGHRIVQVHVKYRYLPVLSPTANQLWLR